MVAVTDLSGNSPAPANSATAGKSAVVGYAPATPVSGIKLEASTTHTTNALAGLQPNRRQLARIFVAPSTDDAQVVAIKFGLDATVAASAGTAGALVVHMRVDSVEEFLLPVNATHVSAETDAGTCDVYVETHNV